jgi:hypothetical protein
VDFIERLDEVGLLSCLASIFVFIAYLRRELISAVISMSIVVYPSHREIFLVTDRSIGSTPSQPKPIYTSNGHVLWVPKQDLS